jgi:hypothetical protein
MESGHGVLGQAWSELQRFMRKVRKERERDERALVIVGHEELELR